MPWKQPIPTNLEEVFGDDHISRLMYIEILLKCTNSAKVVNRNGKITKLGRGQCYFTITELAKRLGRNRKTIRKYLEIMQNVHNVVDNVVDNFGAIISVNKYDEIVSMMDNDVPNDVPNERTTSGQRVPTNKSDKSDKSDTVNNQKEPNGETKTDYATELQTWLNYYNDRTGKKFSTSKLMPNFKYWREFYTLPQMVQAIDRLEFHRWLHDKHTPALILRQKDQKQNPVDRIGELLSLKDPNVLT